MTLRKWAPVVGLLLPCLSKGVAASREHGAFFGCSQFHLTKLIYCWFSLWQTIKKKKTTQDNTDICAPINSYPIRKLWKKKGKFFCSLRHIKCFWTFLCSARTHAFCPLWSILCANMCPCIQSLSVSALTRLHYFLMPSYLSRTFPAATLALVFTISVFFFLYFFFCCIPPPPPA